MTAVSYPPPRPVVLDTPGPDGSGAQVTITPAGPLAAVLTVGQPSD